MFEKSAVKQAKSRMLVHFLTAGNKVVEGQLEVPFGESFSAFMNNGSPFVEVETLPHERRLIAKSSIVEAREVMREPGKKVNPFAILKIQKGASFQEVRDAWKKRVKACHPDRMAALDMDEDIEYAARRATQKINMAYEEIVTHLKEQRTTSQVKPKAEASGFSVYY